MLDEAIKKVTGNGLKPSDIIQGAEGAEGPSEVRYRAHVAFSTAYDILAQLEKISNRRKAVIWVSNGYDFNPFAESRLGEDPMFGGRFGQTREEGQQTERSVQEQQPVRGRGPGAGTRGDHAHRQPRQRDALHDRPARPGGRRRTSTRRSIRWSMADYVRKSQDSLRVLAEETGGIAVVNQNNFDKALKRIDAETSDYYVLGYYSTNPDPLKRTRKIEVKLVEKPGLNVWSRTSYSLRQVPGQTPKK